MEYIIEVNVSGKWYLLCPLTTKDEAQAQAQYNAINNGTMLSWARKDYPTNEFRLSTIPHSEAWWTDDNWLG